MNAQNIKTAASESTERWVKQHFDVYLSTRTSSLVRLAKSEGDLMMHRALSALSVVNTEDLFDDVSNAARLIDTMMNNGEIATLSAYDLASSVHALAIELCSEAWESEGVAGLPSLALLQADAPKRRNAQRLAQIESTRPFGVIVCGRMEFPEDEPIYGTFWCDGEVCLGRADSILDAMELLVKADQNRDWKLCDERDSDIDRDMGPVGFSPRIVTITDLENRVVLRGNACTLEWSVPETDPAAFERTAALKAELLRKAAYESGWDNYETARQLRSEASMLNLTSVHALWQNSPEVTDALTRYRHPSTRLDETELMEMAF